MFRGVTSVEESFRLDVTLMPDDKAGRDLAARVKLLLQKLSAPQKQNAAVEERTRKELSATVERASAAAAAATAAAAKGDHPAWGLAEWQGLERIIDIWKASDTENRQLHKRLEDAKVSVQSFQEEISQLRNYCGTLEGQVRAAAQELERGNAWRVQTEARMNRARLLLRLRAEIEAGFGEDLRFQKKYLLFLLEAAKGRIAERPLMARRRSAHHRWRVLRAYLRAAYRLKHIFESAEPLRRAVVRQRVTQKRKSLGIL